MNNKKRTTILVSLFVLGILLVTTGSTLAFLQFKKTGTSFSTITADSITFHYKEVDGVGHGISITDGMPVTSNVAARSAGTGFNFKITSKSTNNVEIPYTVTARLGSGTDAVMGGIVDTYLTEVDVPEVPTALYTNGEKTYDSLSPYTVNGVAVPNEKIIYTGTVPENTANYSKDFRFRIWIDQNANFAEMECSVNPSTNTTEALCTQANGDWVYKYNDKEFSVTINIYATGAVPEVIPDENTITRIAFENRPLSIYIDPYDSNKYAYIYFPMYPNIGSGELAWGNGSNNASIDITTQYNNADIEVIPTDDDYIPLAYNEKVIKPRIQRISSTNNYRITLSVDHISYDYQGQHNEYDAYANYYCIIRLRSKKDPTVIYDEIYVYIYPHVWEPETNMNPQDYGYSEVRITEEYATWFANEGRETYCADIERCNN